MNLTKQQYCALQGTEAARKESLIYRRIHEIDTLES